jgi:hypothetical protein
MHWIDESTVERTWVDVGGLDVDQATDEMVSLGESQPDLLAFVTTWAEDMSPEAQELAIYLFFVIYRMFSRGYGRPLPYVSADVLIQQHEETERLMESLLDKDDSALGLAAIQESSRQPWVMKYLVEALMESPDEEEAVDLSEDDFGELFLILKTVVDALDVATDSES